MNFFCIAGLLLCLPPHNVNAWTYSAYYAVPIQNTQPVALQRVSARAGGPVYDGPWRMTPVASPPLIR
jgi:hypothetical protein